MLILTRTKDGKVFIGEGENQVVLTIVEITGDRVRLGFDARKDIPIHRHEVQDAINRGYARKGVKRLDRAAETA